MAERGILHLGNTLLWKRSARVEDARAADVEALVRDLSDTLAEFRRASGFGRGIAAPQIGSLRQVIFIRMQPDGFAGPLINPQIVWASDERMELWDDCFSFPELMVRVSRAERIRVTYVDGSGSAREIEAVGDLSELLQHEIDHLGGVLATDRAVSARAFMTRREWERQLRG